MPSEGKTSLAREYAKCKNRAGDFTIAVSSICRSAESRGLRGRKLAMTDDLSRPATAAPVTERKPLSPAANRALAEADARRKAAAATVKPPPTEFHPPNTPDPTRSTDCPHN